MYCNNPTYGSLETNIRGVECHFFYQEGNHQRGASVNHAVLKCRKGTCTKTTKKKTFDYEARSSPHTP